MITVTPIAVEKIKEAMAAEGRADLHLRIYVEGGGCAWTFFMNMDAFAQGNVPWLGLLRVIPILLVALTIGAVAFTVLAWQRRYWQVAGRVHYTLVTLAAVAQLWFLYNANLFARGL